MGGDKNSGGSNKMDKAAGKIAMDYYNQTDPMRQQMIGNYGNFMEGGYDVSQNPVWGAGRGVIEDQYNVARENTIGASPRGGALTDQLAGVEESRAGALGNLAANVSQDEYNKAYGMATGVPQQSMGTLTTLAGNQAMANSQEQAGKYGALGGMGQGLGMYLGSK